MSNNLVYENLRIPFTGVLFERAAERAVVAALGEFQIETNEPLYDCPVLPGARGVPLIFKTFSPNDAGTEDNEFDEAKKAASHIMVLGNDYAERNGHESCQIRIVVITQMADGTPAEQLALHERRCAAVRGIMSPSAQPHVVQVCNRLTEELNVVGWQSQGPAQDEYIGHRWVHTVNYTFTAASLSGVI